MLDMEALVKEAYESSKLKVEADRKDTKEPDDGDRVVFSEAKVWPLQRSENGTLVPREGVRSEPPYRHAGKE